MAVLLLSVVLCGKGDETNRASALHAEAETQATPVAAAFAVLDAHTPIRAEVSREDSTFHLIRLVGTRTGRHADTSLKLRVLSFEALSPAIRILTISFFAASAIFFRNTFVSRRTILFIHSQDGTKAH